MLELHYPTVTKTILERQYPGKPTLKVAFGNGNGAIFKNSSKLRASLFVTSRRPRSSRQTNYQVHFTGEKCLIGRRATTWYCLSRDARCGGGKIKLVLSFRVSLFCFCNNFSVNVITATSSVSGLFFQWLKYAFYFFCRFLPCTFILVRRGCEESAFNAAQQNPQAF